MRNILFSVLSLTFAFGIVQAQDVLFSAIYNYREWQNPAFVGLLPSDWQVGVVYRNQWQQIPVPYKTGEFYVHYKGLERKMEPMWIGLGISGHTAMATKHLKRTTAQVSGALLTGLSNTLFVGAGASISYSSLAIDINGLLFESQLTNKGFDPTLPTQESVVSDRTSGVGFHVGALGGIRTLNNNIYILSFGIYQVISPLEQVNTSTEWRRNERLTILATANTYVSNRRLILKPILFAAMQGSAVAMATGGAIVYNVEQTTMKGFFGGGLIYHLGRFLSPIIMAEIYSLRVYLAYDFNLGTLSSDLGTNGAIEINVEFNYPPQHIRKYKSIYCPRF
ncbi:MAG: type IX secretion system membrane protein PorP/SprF [Chlorobi bacterium]|nr:type IX secretion system membrane protein PorP/SprF [Chlorobiota bacterium]